MLKPAARAGSWRTIRFCVIGAPPISAAVWLVCAAASIKAGASELEHDLDRLPLVHRPVAVRHLVEAHDPVEDPARLDTAIEDVRERTGRLV
jgi:hypothetical protein